MANTKSISLLSASSQSLSITDASQTGLDLGAGGTDFTIMFWVNFTTWNTNTVHGVFGKFGSASQRSYLFRFYNPVAGDQLIINISSNGSTATQASILTGDMVANTWYHYAIVYDASAGTVDLYRNGSALTQASGFPTSIFNSTTPVSIGADNASYDGKIDEMGVYNSVLSQATIQADYNSGNGTERSSSETNIVAGWRFEDDLLDVTANNNDLTNNNSAVFSTDVPFSGVTEFIPKVMFIN